MAEGLGGLAAKVGRGLLAGAVGTAAMTVSITLEGKRRGREPSAAPADAAMKVLGIESFCDDGAKRRFSNVVHWAYGSSWGLPRALLDAAGLGPAAATAAHGGAIWASEQMALRALGVSPPLWEWGATEVAIDAGHHLVYALATSVAYEALR